MKTRTRYLLIAAAAAAVAGIALNKPAPTPADPLPPRPTAAQERSQFPAALPARATISKPHGDVFAVRSWAPSAAPLTQPGPAATPPAPPPMPYKFVGLLTYDGAVQHFVMRGDVVLSVKEGETLDGGYRVEALAAEEITLLYVPLGLQTRLAMASPVDNSASAARASALAANVLPFPSPPIASEAVDSSASVATRMRAAQLRGPRTQAGPITQ